ncbi:pentapeptide repeat-containing protein [Mariniflexile ostreae]|uniref:Pentapeptide repeat-containing protein n=1 Tax=Mariniflexile ostreae TaxID=1520892 RepID=A0ABV5FAD5_9FLAO
MSNTIIMREDEDFINVNYSEDFVRDQEFYDCRFVGCNFTKTDLRGSSFEDCTFQDCNFSMSELEGVGFRNINFIGSKILGIDFTRCNSFMFSFKFDTCRIEYCTFFGTKLKKTAFIKCSLKETDFSEADLSFAVFTNSDLTGTKFSNTTLEKADFREAHSFNIDPELNRLKKAKFYTSQLEGLLYKHQLDIV